MQIIDALILELELDPSKFKKGTNESIESLRKMETEAKKRAGAIEQAAGNTEQAFAGLQKRLLGVAGLLLSGLGVEQFIQKITRLQVATANLGQVLGISSQSLQTWAGAAERFGIPGGAAQGGLATIQAQRFALLNGNPMGSPLLNMAHATWGSPNPMNINPNMGPEQQAMEIAKWLERSPRKAQDAAALTQLGGLSQEFVQLLMQGSRNLERAMEEMKKLTPSNAEINNFKELNKAFSEAAQKAETLGRKLTSDLSPGLVKFFNMISWILEKMGVGKESMKFDTPEEGARMLHRQLRGGKTRPEESLSRAEEQLRITEDHLRDARGIYRRPLEQEQQRLVEEIKRLREEIEKNRQQQGGFQNQSFVGGGQGAHAQLINAMYGGGGGAGGTPFAGGWRRGGLGGGASSPSGGGMAVPDDALAGLNGSAYLQAQRSGLKAELDGDPSLRAQLGGMMMLEGTPLNSMESLANRTIATNKWRASRGLPPLSLKQMLHSGFYGPVNRGQLPGAVARLSRDPALMNKMNSAIDAVMGGSNTLLGATDQGMPTDPNGQWGNWPGGFRLKKGGNVFNDWGGGGGHDFNRAWREETQRRVLQGGETMDGAIPVPIPDPRKSSWDQSLTNSRFAAFGGSGTQGSQSFQIGDIHIHKPVGDAEDLASNVRGNVRRIAQVMSANYGPA